MARHPPSFHRLSAGYANERPRSPAHPAIFTKAKDIPFRYILCIYTHSTNSLYRKYCEKEGKAMGGDRRGEGEGVLLNLALAHPLPRLCDRLMAL